MLNKIIDLLKVEDNAQPHETNREKLIQLSTAALLIEISLADSVISQDETDLMLKIIRQQFDLSHEQADELLSEANDKVNDSISLYEFTNLLKDELTRDERNHIVKLLWQVAFTDSVLDKYEEYYVRKIADLLYVSQDDYIRAKLSADKESA